MKSSESDGRGADAPEARRSPTRRSDIAHACGQLNHLQGENAGGHCDSLAPESLRYRISSYEVSA